MATYKGPDGRLYRVGDAPDAKGEYHIEYLDPASSAVYKRLPGYNGSVDREAVMTRLDKLAKDRGLAQAVAEDSSATEPADRCATCLCNTCADDNCSNAPRCYKDKDICIQTCNTTLCDGYRPKSSPVPVPATAEPQEIVDESSDQDTPAATLTAAPASEIAAPAFDFGALGELAEQAAEDDQEFDFHAARSREEYGFACVYLARVHDLTARAGRYGGGTWTKWCEAKGLSGGTAKRMLEIGDSFKSAKLADLKNLAVFGKGELRAIATSGSEEIKEAAAAGDTERVEELLAQLKAAEAAKRLAETRAVVHERKATTLEDAAKKAQEAAEDLKQKLYRRNEELARKEQALNVTMDQQGVYIAKMQEQEDMLADLQDRLDDTTAQLRSRPVPAEVVDQDEIERRAAELAARKIAEAEARARAETTGKAPTIEGITDLANGYAAQIDGMRAVLAQLTQGLERQAITHAADKLCLAADRLHDLIMYGPEAYSHG